jgi:hypothetical protein
MLGATTVHAIALGLAIVYAGTALAFPRPAREGEEPEIEQPASAEESGALTPPTGGKPANEADDASPDGQLLAPRKKSFRRMQQPRMWSVGGRVGMWGNMGLGAQYIGEGAYAWNLGISVLDMESRPGTVLSLDMLWLYDEDWNRLITPDKGKWQASRGKLVWYHGGGIQLLSEGIYPRIPFGMQFTMLEEPLTWSAQLTFIAGQITGNRPGFAPLVAPEIMVRYLLGGP